MNVADFPKFKFKNDSYTRRRGAPAMLVLSCLGCSEPIICYQKDGPGPLLRCYLDRIHYPEAIKTRSHQPFNKNEAEPLVCNKCNTAIGVPIVYEKEGRPAYHMRPGFFTQKRLYQGKKLKDPAEKRAL